MAVTTSETGAVVEPTASRRRHGALRWAGQVLSWFVMLTIGAVLLVAFVVPRLAGGTTYVVETGSMRPGLPPGTLVVVKPADPTDIAAGDVITYQLRSGDPTVVTHRVVTVGYDGAGEVRWRTQGDANNAVDANWVMQEQLKGRLWYAVPYVGYGTSVVTNQQRGLMVGLIALGLGGYAVVQLSGAWRERRRKQSTADVS